MIGSLSIIQRPSFVETLASIKWFHSRPYIPRAWKGATNGGNPPHRFRSTSSLYLVWQNGLTDSIRIYIRIVINHFKSILLWQTRSRCLPFISGIPCSYDLIPDLFHGIHVFEIELFFKQKKNPLPFGFQNIQVGGTPLSCFFSQAPGRFWKVFRSPVSKHSHFEVWDLLFLSNVDAATFHSWWPSS